MITKPLKPARDTFLPVDLIMDIFSRVPARSVARFRCVSKYWESILDGPYFTELFMTTFIARPRIFFALDVNKELFVFSTPQPQNPVWNSSLVTTPYKACPRYFPTEICITYGLVFLQIWENKTPVIYNPIKGESVYVTLPKVKLVTGSGRSHFGFDPINKQFKVLRTISSCYGRPDTHLVLTLKPGKLAWRRIKDTLLPGHYVIGSNEICINGVVYYRGYYKTSSEIVCFNFSTERFGLINMDTDMLLHARRFTLFNYKGHLGAYQHPFNSLWCNEECVFWVLEDALKHKWSKLLCVVPFWGDEILKKYKFVGMTATGELVFSQFDLPNPFYISYYNIQRKTFARFEIKGFEEFKHQTIVVHTFLDYVENMKFM